MQVEPEPEQIAVADTAQAAFNQPELIAAANEHSRASADQDSNSSAQPAEGAGPEQPAAPAQVAAPESAAEESEPVQQQEEGDAGHEHETEQHSSLPARHEVAHAPQQQQHKHTAAAGASHRSIGPGTIYR